MSNKRITYLGLLLAVALIIGYIEFLLPPVSGVPGVKLGLSNIITLITLKLFGKKEAGIVLVLRILLSGLLFGNLFAVLFSLSGGLLAFFAMLLADSAGRFSLVGISALGGVTHNIGQLLAAMLTLKLSGLIYYAPVLLVSGLICGLLTGFLAGLVLKRLGIQLL